ncbi:MAG: TetR/AcrR family transcriptional regulator [Bdellovibrionales bacterium]
MAKVRKKTQKSGDVSSQVSLKNKIIDAAFFCFAESGVGTTKLTQIAAKAGVEAPHMHYYFPTFEALFTEVVNIALEDLRAYSVRNIEKGRGDPRKALDLYVKAPFEWAKERPTYLPVWMYFYHLAACDKKFGRLNRNIREIGRDRISLLIYKGIETGQFKKNSEFEVPELATLIQGLMTGHGVLAASEEGGDFDQQYRLALKAIHSLILK